MSCGKPSSVTGGGPDDFGKALLQAHNTYRAKHGSPPLSWSEEAAKAARSWADHLASTGRLQHGNHEGLYDYTVLQSAQVVYM